MKRIGISDLEIKTIRTYKKSSKDNNVVLVEDLSILAMVKEYGICVKTFLVCPEICNKGENVTLIHELEAIAEKSFEISKKTYEFITEKENSAGLFAVVEKNFNDLSLLKKNNQFVLVLDHMEIPGNLGTILRTADATGVDLVLNVDSVTSINHPKVTIASRGMNLVVPVLNMTYEDASKHLCHNGFDIFLGEPMFGKDFREYDYLGKVAIVVGSERFGIQQNWYQQGHKKVFIPMKGKMRSLNVGVAASLLLYEVSMKKSKEKTTQ